MTQVDDFVVSSNAPETVPEAPTPEPAAESVSGAVENGVHTDSTDPPLDPASAAGKTHAEKKKTYQPRIDELTREKHEAQRQAESTKAELAALRQELEGLKAPKPKAEPAEQKPKVEDFTTYEEWVEAVSDWKADLKLAAYQETTDKRFAEAQQASAASTAQRAYQEAQTRVVKAGAEKFADFDATLGQQFDRGIRWSPFVTDVVLSHPLGPDIAYALAKDDAAAERISAAPTVAIAGMEMGQFLARLDAAASGTTSEMPKTHAKPPIKPLGGAPVTSDPSPDDLEFGPEYVRRMNKAHGR